MSDELMEVHGLAELEDALVALGKKAGTKVLRSSLMYATTPTLKRAKERVTVDPNDQDGHLRDALGRATKVLRNGSVQLRLGERKKAPKLTAKYRVHGHLQEFGARHHAAAPFLRPALDDTYRQVVDRFAKKFKQQLGH